MKIKTIVQATLLVSIFFGFFSCAKEEDVPLKFEEGKRIGVYAQDASGISCVANYFIDYDPDSPPQADATAWHAPIDMGRLIWSDDTTTIDIVSMRFEVRNSSCIEDFIFNVTDSMKACMTLSNDAVPIRDDEYGTVPSLPHPFLSWTYAVQPIGPNRSVKFHKLLYVYGMKPKVPKGVDPDKYVPNCTASGLIKISAIKYTDNDISNGKNVRKSFPFSIIFE